MIRVSPDNDPGRALRLISLYPNEIDGRILADHLRPLPKLTGTAGYLAWRREVLALRGPREAWGSRLLSRLQERGLIATTGAPRLADWLVDRAARIGWRRALAVTLLCSPDDVPPAIFRLVMRVVEDPPGSTAALIGKHPSGRQQEHFRKACAVGFLVPSSRRELTDAGRELVASWDQV